LIVMRLLCLWFLCQSSVIAMDHHLSFDIELHLDPSRCHPFYPVYAKIGPQHWVLQIGSWFG
jgi:hypothetical protein